MVGMPGPAQSRTPPHPVNRAHHDNLPLNLRALIQDQPQGVARVLAAAGAAAGAAGAPSAACRRKPRPPASPLGAAPRLQL